MTALPGTSLVRRNDTHRLIHSQYRDEGSSVLARIADQKITNLAEMLPWSWRQTRMGRAA